MSVLMRGLLVVAVAAAAGVWLLGSTASPQIETPPEQHAADPGSARPDDPPRSAGGVRPPDPDRLLGVQLSAHHTAHAGRSLAVMDRLAEAGAGWVRVDVGWATLQPDGPGHLEDWYVDLLDDVLEGAHDRGLKVILAFWLTPPWASSSGSLYAPPADPADYAHAIGMVAQRWADRVDAWEVWNEPNFPTFFEGADPAVYAGLLCAAYPAVKAADDSPVLVGGLMYNDDTWLDRLYRADARDCFDGVATHPYVGPSDAAPDTPSVGEVWRLTHTPAVRSVMTEWGDRRKRIWITELGWSSGPDSAGNPWDRAVSPRKQALFLGQAVSLVRHRYPYVGPIIWYRDVDGPTDGYQDGFGLMHPDLRPKPALTAFRIAAHGGPAVRRPAARAH